MNQLETRQRQRFNRLAAPYLDHPDVRRMNGFVQHGSTSTLAHCVRVARTSFLWAERLGIAVNERDLVAGALLHDFYLYDWHDRVTSRSHHATRHPLYAVENARRAFDVNDAVAHIISAHMWPLPPSRPPKSREAALVCVADKWCSLQETLIGWR